MTPAQIEMQRARWRRAKAKQRARAQGQNAPTGTKTVLAGARTPVLRAEVDWRDRGACRGTSPKVMDGETAQDTTEAKMICGRCEVRVECLRFALETNATHGVWGGVNLGVETVAVAS